MVYASDDLRREHDGFLYDLEIIENMYIKPDFSLKIVNGFYIHC